MRLRALSGVLLAFLIEGSIKAQSAIAFTKVAVVDVEKGALRLDQTVVIEGSRITAAGDAQRIRAPRGARVIDGEGKFLMPGLWDMHVHAMPKPQFATCTTTHPRFVIFGKPSRNTAVLGRAS
jgi:cytosine/adenosine deaminase-related metal-dependent hydrolase